MQSAGFTRDEVLAMAEPELEAWLETILGMPKPKPLLASPPPLPSPALPQQEAASRQAPGKTLSFVSKRLKKGPSS